MRQDINGGEREGQERTRGQGRRDLVTEKSLRGRKRKEHLEKSDGCQDK